MSVAVSNLTPEGQRLADALVKAGVLLSWQVRHETLRSLNTAAALLLTAPEGEGAGLPEVDARKAYEAYYRGIKPRDFSDLAPEYRQSWLDVADALAPQPPKAETPAGVGVEPDDEADEEEGNPHLNLANGIEENLKARGYAVLDASDWAMVTAALRSTAPAARPGDEVDGFVRVPREPTEAMWGGLARQIVMWQRFAQPTGAKLYRHLKACGWPVPEWLEAEIPDRDHVPSKGSVAVAIYRAMLAAAAPAADGGRA